MPDGSQQKLFNNIRGTIEFWVRPDWRGAWAKPINRFEPRPHRHTFVDFSASQHIWYHRGPVIIEHVDRRLGLVFSTSKIYKNTGVSATADVSQRDVLRRHEWHHLACVWDESAVDDDRLRIYFDGRRVSKGVRIQNPEQWAENEPLMDADAPFVVQIGCRNTGVYPMRALLKNLRISSIARYAGEFQPPENMELDIDTTTFFPFDGTLRGVGITTDGEKYELNAVAGVVAHR